MGFLECRCRVVRFVQLRKCARCGGKGGRDRSNGSETRCSTTIGLLDRRVWMEGASASVKPGQLTQWKEVVLRPPDLRRPLAPRARQGQKQRRTGRRTPCKQTP